MKNVVVTLLGIIVLAIATATAAFGAQTAQVSSAVHGLSDSLIRAGLQGEISGQILGLTGLPSTSTGGGMDGLALAVGGIAVASGAFILVRKAMLDS
ncbi:MAG: hypothetical protein QOH08_753 [Chloroflexota bacterium]|jgi:hypothetical protein|nr:hypothetical protein [Chloroflexota bacterium]